MLTFSIMQTTRITKTTGAGMGQEEPGFVYRDHTGHDPVADVAKINNFAMVAVSSGDLDTDALRDCEAKCTL